jgi:hypothetical protein
VVEYLTLASRSKEEKKMNDRSTFLFAMPGFLSGMGSVLDLAGNSVTINSSSSEEEADAVAVRQDWLAIGDDMRKVIANFTASK